MGEKHFRIANNTEKKKKKVDSGETCEKICVFNQLRCLWRFLLLLIHSLAVVVQSWFSNFFLSYQALEFPELQTFHQSEWHFSLVCASVQSMCGKFIVRFQLISDSERGIDFRFLLFPLYYNNLIWLLDFGRRCMLCFMCDVECAASGPTAARFHLACQVGKYSNSTLSLSSKTYKHT